MYHIAGLSKSEKLFEKKSSGLTAGRLLDYMWELQGWRDLKKIKSELKRVFGTNIRQRYIYRSYSTPSNRNNELINGHGIINSIVSSKYNDV